jgi:hypothetical protein
VNRKTNFFSIPTNDVRNSRINFPVAINRNLLAPYGTMVTIYIGQNDNNPIG